MTATPEEGQPIQLECDGVTKRFGGVTAVNDVTFAVRRHEKVGLIGPNGAGKTTLFNVVTGFAPASAGQVRWEGRDITRVHPSNRTKFGLVRSFQRSRVFPGLTVQDNLRTACHIAVQGNVFGDLFRSPRSRQNERTIRERTEELLEEYALTDVAHRPAGELSYGLGKRIGFVMALAPRPRMLLLDEPAAGLNRDEVDLLRTDLEGLSHGGVTVMFVEHHMGLVMQVAERIIVLDAGQMIAEGTPAQIATDARVVDAYLGTNK